MIKKTFLVTAPLYYVNSSPHLGHLYSSLFADFLARYKKMQGYQVFFVMGADQNGQKILNASQDANIGVKKFVDKNTTKFKELWKLANIGYTHFVETSSFNHAHFVQLMFQKLKDDQQLDYKNYVGLYCVHCENFHPQTSNTKCPLCKREMKKFLEENYFLKFNLNAQKQIQKLILQWQKKEKTFTNQLKDFFAQRSSKDFSITRKNSPWGIMVDYDQNQFAYVWFDALLGYISVLNPQEQTLIWKNSKTEIIQIIGKEIMKFHLIYWPTMLMRLDYRLPNDFLVHGWILKNQTKMSKTTGNTISPVKIINKFDADVVRLYLCSIMNSDSDVTFNTRDFYKFYESFVVDNLSNFHFRIITMCKKYLPDIQKQKIEDSQSLTNFMDEFIEEYHQFWVTKSFTKIFKQIDTLLNNGNQMINHEEPWKMHKQKKYNELTMTMLKLLNILKIVADLLNPIAPSISKRIYASLNCRIIHSNFYKTNVKLQQLSDLEKITYLYEKEK